MKKYSALVIPLISVFAAVAVPAFALSVKEPIAVDGATAVIVDADGDGLPDLQNVGGRAELDQYNAAASERVLPTVNKKTTVTISNEGRDRMMMRVIVRGWDAEKKELVEDFEKNIEAVAGADGNIVSAEVTPDAIKVSYKRPAKLFGFIPVAYYHAFTVDGKGNVAQGHPWWLAFAADDAATFGPDVAEVFQHNQSDLRFIKMQTMMEQQLQRFSALSNVMKSRHEAAMNSIRNMK